jgi:exodeoxyribonuclease VII small subunit
MSDLINKTEAETFESAYARLQQLVEEMEAGSLSLDQLVDRVEQAQTLLRFCHDSLRTVKEEISRMHSPNADPD